MSYYLTNQSKKYLFKRLAVSSLRKSIDHRQTMKRNKYFDMVADIFDSLSYMTAVIFDSLIVSMYIYIFENLQTLSFGDPNDLI